MLDSVHMEQPTITNKQPNKTFGLNSRSFSTAPLTNTVMINANALAVIEPTDTLTSRNPAKNTTEPSKLIICVHKYLGRFNRNCIYCHSETFAGMSLVYSFKNGFVTPHITAASKISQNIALLSFYRLLWNKNFYKNYFLEGKQNKV